jgi:hypothetical protein
MNCSIPCERLEERDGAAKCPLRSGHDGGFGHILSQRQSRDESDGTVRRPPAVGPDALVETKAVHARRRLRQRMPLKKRTPPGRIDGNFFIRRFSERDQILLTLNAGRIRQATFPYHSCPEKVVAVVRKQRFRVEPILRNGVREPPNRIC